MPRLGTPAGSSVSKQLEILDHGPAITPVDLKHLERELSVVLPQEYRSFLLRCNGGSPTPDVMAVPGLPGSPTDVQVFFGIGRSTETSEIIWNLELLKLRCPTLNALPIACDSGGNLFLLNLAGTDEVLYVDLEEESCRQYVVAGTFGEFLGRLGATSIS